MFSNKQKIGGLIVFFVILSSLLLLKNLAPQKQVDRASTTKEPQVILPTKQVIYQGDRKKREIALTFDADMTSGMEKQLTSGQVKSWYNQAVIEILNSTHTPATLFLTGMWIETYPEVTRQLADNSLFELANHSYSHPGFTPNCYKLRSIENKADKDEIEKTQKLLKDITHKDNRLFRFPGGCFDNEDLKVLYSLNLLPIQWDVASGDAFNTNTEQIVRNVLNRSQNGSIIVFHLHGGPNAPQTAQALPRIIDGLKSKGFTFVQVTQLLAGLQ